MWERKAPSYWERTESYAAVASSHIGCGIEGMAARKEAANPTSLQSSARRNEQPPIRDGRPRMCLAWRGRGSCQLDIVPTHSSISLSNLRALEIESQGGVVRMR